jgi:hypothetical protein
MSGSRFVILSFVSLFVLSSGNAFALEDGWYHAVDVKGSCPEAQSAVIYLEADMPISVSITAGSAQLEEHKKLTPTKANYVYNTGKERATLQMWKAKNNQVYSKIIQANGCVGAEITFAK